MCKPKPGPRCFNSLKKDLQAKVVNHNKSKAELSMLKEEAAANPTDLKLSEAVAAKQVEVDELSSKHDEARANMNSSPKIYGQLFKEADRLAEAGENEASEKIRQLAREGYKKHKTAERALAQTQFLEAIQNPKPVIADFYNKVPHAESITATIAEKYGFDQAQIDGLLVKSIVRKPSKKLRAPDRDEWNNYVTEQRESLITMPKISDERLTEIYSSYKKNKLRRLPNGDQYTALNELERNAEKAYAALRRQVDYASALRGANVREATEKFDSYRQQYLTEYAHLPAEQQPTPPADWTRGVLTKDTLAVSVPCDKATMYALYRCQADPDAFPQRAIKYASVDIETTGPEGKTGLDPDNGGIIEVGIVTYDENGNEVDSYSSMVDPGNGMLEKHGTGAVHVHGITMDDMKDAPQWTNVARDVEQKFDGAVLIIQNANYERSWFDKHMPAVGANYDFFHSHVDTMRIAQQHQPDLENFRLHTICGANGIEYTNGHRAEHDARVAADAFFAMKNKIHTRYRENTVFANLPQPEKTETVSKVFRFGPKDLFVSDPWEEASRDKD